MALRGKGDLTVVELESEREWDSLSGWRAVRKWRGLKQDIQQFIPNVQGPGVRLTVRPDEAGPYAILEARFDNAQDGTQDDEELQLTTLWELAGNDLEKDLFDNALFAALTDADQKALRAFRDNPTGADPTLVAAVAENFLTEIKNGTQSYTVAQYVLRRTQTVNSGWVGNVAVSNVGRQYTAAGLIAAEDVPNDLIFSVSTIGGAWLKRTPSVQQLANGKLQITQEWWHADTWSTLLYPAAA